MINSTDSGEIDSGVVSATLNMADLRESPVELLAVSSLLGACSPRLEGEDLAHVHLLAELETGLPPIVVHRGTMKVIDGMHRVRAALRRGQSHIQARFFDGDEDDAFVYSVVANMRHGLPLSLADRVAAAQRIFRSHPRLSDRAVASLTGISAKKASELRPEPAVEQQARLGRDGRYRPLSSAQGRQRASELIKSDPSASLRQIAKVAGISPATVADVRDRMRRGMDVVPKTRRGPDGGRYGRAKVIDGRQRADGQKSINELMSIFERVRKDPSLRFSEAGRAVLRMLDVCAMAVREKHKIIESMPPHCAEPIAELVQGYAEIWHSFGEELKRNKRIGA
ncbi:ParB/RepB/Spo0J family partition protein [Sphaerisporangium sp. B11E5]|uniref:ParB/RepB/Spo0J family partition protein n=1 Tax=Sphaerisporangium sp. B11E5 TaxID=3153563 RepID=UPI00325CF69A